MFERFTDRARRVVVLAQEQARLLGHNHIGTEHLLLGLIHEDSGVAARALHELGVDHDRAREELREITGEGMGSPVGHIPFTSRAKTVLQMSLREALDLGHNYIGTEHILLALVREGDGLGAAVLDKHGADAPSVRKVVVRLMSGGGAAGGGSNDRRDAIGDPVAMWASSVGTSPPDWAPTLRAHGPAPAAKLVPAVPLSIVSLLAGIAAAVVGQVAGIGDRIAMWSLGIGVLASTLAAWATVLGSLPSSGTQRLAQVAAMTGASAFALFAIALAATNLT